MCPARRERDGVGGICCRHDKYFEGFFRRCFALALSRAARACVGPPTQNAIDPPMAEGNGAVAAASGDGSVVSRFAGHEWMFGTVPATARPASEDGDPIKVGLINTDSGPVAAMPELHQATIATIEFVNAELGGVSRRPSLGIGRVCYRYGARVSRTLRSADDRRAGCGRPGGHGRSHGPFNRNSRPERHRVGRRNPDRSDRYR